MKKICYDSINLDDAKIIEDSKRWLKVKAIITKAGVYKYDDGYALKPARELLNAVTSARYAKLHWGNHPDTMVIMANSQIHGGLEKVFWDRNRMHAILAYDKTLLPEGAVEQIRKAVLEKTGLDVSIGFYFRPEWSPGVDKDVNTGLAQKYDYIMRDILIDHIASGYFRGRCTYPACGIGVDTILKRISLRLVETDKVVKRGNKWCVIHCHGAKAGKAIVCKPTKEEADRVHRAIMARKGGAFLDYGQLMSFSEDDYKGIFGDQDDRPPKVWFEACKTSTPAGKMTDPAAFCGWLWHHGEKAGERFAALRRSFGASRGRDIMKKKTDIGGGKLSEQETRYPERTQEERECVEARVGEGMERGQAEALCFAATKPSDEPTPPGGTLDQEDQSDYQKCIAQKMKDGLSMEEAAEACKEKKADEDAAFENCVVRLMDEGKTKDEAERECREKHPLPTGEDQEAEPTPLEKCVKTQMEAGKTEEEATEWCEAELAGEHEKTQDLIDDNIRLIALKKEDLIKKRKAAVGT